MTTRELLGIKRELAFPVRMSIYRIEDYDITVDDGRILIGHYDMNSGSMMDGFIDLVRPDDIVFIPLYGGRWNDDGKRWMADDTSQRLLTYDENISILRELAGSVAGILVGNSGPELSFKHLIMHDGMSREDCVRRMCEFVLDTADIIVGAGGNPVYGVMDWDLALDCYFGDAAYRDAVNEVDGLDICFCGFQLLGRGRRERFRLIPSLEDDRCWDVCPHQEGNPWPILTEYISGMRHPMSGVEGITGLTEGNDVILANHGFVEGIVGENRWHTVLKGKSTQVV